MLQIKKEYIGKIIYSGKLAYDVNVSNIKVDEYQMYYNNGLSFIFENVCSKCKNELCICQRDYKQALKDATDFMNN